MDPEQHESLERVERNRVDFQNSLGLLLLRLRSLLSIDVHRVVILVVICDDVLRLRLGGRPLRRRGGFLGGFRWLDVVLILVVLVRCRHSIITIIILNVAT
jgi:hypothetical protein